MDGVLKKTVVLLTFLVSCVVSQSIASSCSSTLTASYPTPSVADGYVARLVANGLSDPRDIVFDNQGNLLVVESGTGITALSFMDSNDGCISVRNRTTVVNNKDLNHGIAISSDGTTLYASSPESVYRWRYNAQGRTLQSDTAATLVTNMTTTDHTTRTLLLPKSAPGLLVVTRGSTSNIDPLAEILSSGHSQIKAFNITNSTSAYDFDGDGLLLGWGLRNDVGIDEHPTAFGIWSVENSVDQMTRNGVDIHNTNPGEELNFLGYLNGTQSPNQGANFGYPECYAAWDVGTIPDAGNLTTGEQFAIGNLTATNSDAMCAERQAPRLTFHPHMAPLDILFNDQGTAAWVTFHGSWDSDPPVGYKLSVVQFENGEPASASTSLNSTVDILSNADVSKCGSVTCFRPVGLAWDSNGRLFMSSDATGEIYAILRADGSSTNNANVTGSGSSGNTPTKSIASSSAMSLLAVVFAAFAFLL